MSTTVQRMVPSSIPAALEEKKVMSIDEREPREVTPFAKSMGKISGFKDFAPKIEKSELHEQVNDEEKAEVEEALTPTPKDSSAQESATSSESETVPPKSDFPALPSEVLPTEKLEAAVKASGKDSEPSEEEPQTPDQTTPEGENSSQDSSSETSPGKSTPPAPVKPPTVEQPPKP